MVRQAVALCAVTAIIALAASCGPDPYTYGDCENSSDCHQVTQQIPGTICEDGTCRCEDSSQVICCEFGDTRPHCPVACRDCLECAEGTEGCPKYECHKTEDCKSREALCPTIKQCEQGKCVYIPFAGKALKQKEGDCAELSCRSDGTYFREPDSQDVLHVGACASVLCDGINELRATAVDGSGCSAGYCVGGRCVPCYRNEDCDAGNQSCDKGKCVPARCADSFRNGGESDVDCGGSECARCNDGQRCGGDADCTSDVCQNQHCIPPAFGDGRINGTESDRDCGGLSAPPCEDTQLCLYHSDCASEVCFRGVCRAPSCDDGTQNQGEEGPDCGGPCTLPCL